MENFKTSSELQNQILSNTSLINLDSNTLEENNKSSEKPIKKPLSKIDLLYQSLFKLYCQKQFKKLVKSLRLKSDRLGKYLLSEWKLLHLRMFTFQTILEEKISNHFSSNKIQHFSKYLRGVNKDINNWIKMIKQLIEKEDKKFIGSFTEFIITFLLNNCIILGKKYIHTGNIIEAIIAFSLGVRLISYTIFYLSSPDSFYLAGEIFLNLSSFMIAEKNYKTAINLISLSIKMSYLSLELKLSKNFNNNHILFDLNGYKREIKNISKIFFHLSISFYQLAICQEHCKDPYNGYFSIKTSKFFLKFTNFDIFSHYLNFILKIEKRLLIRNRIILFFETSVRKEELEDKILKQKSSFKMMISYEEKKQKKFQKLKNFIEKLKISDIDDDEPDLFNKVGDKQIKPSILKMTKHMKLLNYLMNDEFKDLVDNMDKIEINKLDKETINKISKRIISIKNKEHFKLENKLRKQFSIKKKLKERKNSAFLENNEKEEIDYKIQNNKNKNNMNKSNIFKSTTALSLSTSINKKTPRIRSAFNRNQKKIIQRSNRGNTSKVLSFRNTSQKMTFSNVSIYSTPSGYLSMFESNISKKKNTSINFFIRNSRLSSSNNMNLKLNSDLINYKLILNKKSKVLNSNNKIKTPRYNPDKLVLSKGFKKKFSFLENQFNKEINFHKNLLRTKSIQEELEKPKAPNLKEINEKVKKFFYVNYYNELMNAREKQIVFDKKEVTKKNKEKTSRRYNSPEPQIFRKLIKRNEAFFDTEEAKDENNKIINRIEKNIMEINYKKAVIKKMKE